MQRDASKSRLKQTFHATKHTVRHHYYKKMPDKKSHRVLIWTAFLSYSLMAALQLLYPLDRALPLASIPGKDVGWQQEVEVAKAIQMKFQTSKLRLTAGQASVTVKLGATGAEPNLVAMISNAEEYPLWQRFIPFSIFWQDVKQDTLDIDFAGPVLKKFAAEKAAKLSSEPVNARLAIEHGKLVAEAEKTGLMVSPDDIAAAIRLAAIGDEKMAVVPVSGQPRPPEKTSNDFSAVKSQAEAALSRPVIIETAARQFTPTDEAVASWLVISADKSGRTLLTFDSKRFDKYLDRIDGDVGVSAGTTKVTITDGVETDRQTGRTGSAITREPLRAAVKGWLLHGEGAATISAEFHPISPQVVYDRKYTSSEAGLRAYVTDQARFMNVHIAIQQITGSGWSASARAGESIPSASTYKLYVSKWLFNRMDKGKVHWNDPMLGTTVSACFDEMTIISANRCAETWIAQAGRSNLNNLVYNLGFSHGTSFTTGGATQTTANDLRKFMVGLNNGSLIGGAHRDRLLHSLSVHPYRSGIPAGSKGKVWDKVGFLWDYVHDAAIVQHPRGRYVMVIMTKGQSYARIAEITRAVERIMYP